MFNTIEIQQSTAVNKTEIESKGYRFAIISLPHEWWRSTFMNDNNVKKVTAEIYNINSKLILTKREKKLLPVVKNWEIRQGDYRRHLPAGKDIQKIRKNKKNMEKAELSFAVLLSIALTIFFSFWLTKAI